MSKQRKFILISAAIGVVSVFLPWFKVSLFGFTQTVNGMHGDGLFVLALFIVSGVLAFLGDQLLNLDKTKWMITLIAGGLAALIVIYDIINASNSAFGSFLSFGIYFAALAGIGIVLSAFLFKSATDNLKDGFSSLKSNIESRMKSNQATPTTTTTGNTSGPDKSSNINSPL